MDALTVRPDGAAGASVETQTQRRRRSAVRFEIASRIPWAPWVAHVGVTVARDRSFAEDAAFNVWTVGHDADSTRTVA